MKRTSTLEGLSAILPTVIIGLVPVLLAAADPEKGATPPAGVYRLGAGDKLRIEVYKDAQLSQSLQIRPDGKITLPLVGDVEAAGKTPVELRDVITGHLSEYITHPVVSVIVVEATAAVAYVLGEVARPGPVVLTDGRLTALQAIAMAGGLKDFADRKNIRILRPSLSGSETILFNYNDAIRGRAPVYLQANDTVVVPD
jgi:polysaccharide export outer membrane protein